MLRASSVPARYVDRVVACTDPSSTTRHGVFVRDPFDAESLCNGCHDGPVSLLGDAMLPMSPEGGQLIAMTLEDAAELALCVREYGLGGPALREYEARRIPRVRRVAQVAHLEALRTAGRNAEASEREGELDPLPECARVANFAPDMDYHDWLYDVRFPDL